MRLSALVCAPLVVFLGVSARLGSQAPQTPSPSADELKSAAGKAIALIQKSVALWDTKRDCFTCHHHALPLAALRIAKERAVPFDEVAARAIEGEWDVPTIRDYVLRYARESDANYYVGAFSWGDLTHDESSK